MDQDQTRPDEKPQTSSAPGANTPDTTLDSRDPRDPYSRRRFLRAAVIGAAGVAGAAGAAGVVMASGAGPSILSHFGAGTANVSTPSCIDIDEAFKFNNKNSQLIIDGSSATDPEPSMFPSGTCFELTDKNGNLPTLYGQVTGSGTKAGTKDHWQLPITISCPTTLSNETYPEGSSLCVAPCGLTCDQV